MRNSEQELRDPRRERKAADTQLSTMKALEVHGATDLRLVEITRPAAGPDEVVVQVAYCGICGSDFPRYFQGEVHQVPQILGHEFSGVVVATGAGVSDVQIGQRAAIAPLVPCGACPACTQGRPALCRRYSFIGSRRQGALAEYVAVPAANIVPIDDEVSLRAAALIEPLSVALHGIARASYAPDGRGERVVVFGAGVIGLLTVQALKARGIGHVTAVDVHAGKLDLASRLGADAVVTADEVPGYFAESAPPTVCIETAGHPATQAQAVQYCGSAGQVVFVGTSHREVSFPPATFGRILRGELTLLGSWMSYSAPFPGPEWTSAVHLIARGTVQVEPLVSRVYDLAVTAQPFTDIQQSHGSFLKVLYQTEAAAQEAIS